MARARRAGDIDSAVGDLLPSSDPNVAVSTPTSRSRPAAHFPGDAIRPACASRGSRAGGRHSSLDRVAGDRARAPTDVDTRRRPVTRQERPIAGVVSDPVDPRSRISATVGPTTASSGSSSTLMPSSRRSRRRAWRTLRGSSRAPVVRSSPASGSGSLGAGLVDPAAVAPPALLDDLARKGPFVEREPLVVAVPGASWIRRSRIPPLTPRSLSQTML